MAKNDNYINVTFDPKSEKLAREELGYYDNLAQATGKYLQKFSEESLDTIQKIKDAALEALERNEGKLLRTIDEDQAKSVSFDFQEAQKIKGKIDEIFKEAGDQLKVYYSDIKKTDKDITEYGLEEFNAEFDRVLKSVKTRVNRAYKGAGDYLDQISFKQMPTSTRGINKYKKEVGEAISLHQKYTDEAKDIARKSQELLSKEFGKYNVTALERMKGANKRLVAEKNSLNTEQITQRVKRFIDDQEKNYGNYVFVDQNQDGNIVLHVVPREKTTQLSYGNGGNPINYRGVDTKIIVPRETERHTMILNGIERNNPIVGYNTIIPEQGQVKSYGAVRGTAIDAFVENQIKAFKSNQSVSGARSDALRFANITGEKDKGDKKDFKKAAQTGNAQSESIATNNLIEYGYQLLKEQVIHSNIENVNDDKQFGKYEDRVNKVVKRIVEIISLKNSVENDLSESEFEDLLEQYYDREVKDLYIQLKTQKEYEDTLSYINEVSSGLKFNYASASESVVVHGAFPHAPNSYIYDITNQSNEHRDQQQANRHLMLTGKAAKFRSANKNKGTFLNQVLASPVQRQKKKPQEEDRSVVTGRVTEEALLEAIDEYNEAHEKDPYFTPYFYPGLHENNMVISDKYAEGFEYYVPETETMTEAEWRSQKAKGSKKRQKILDDYKKQVDIIQQNFDSNKEWERRAWLGQYSEQEQKKLLEENSRLDPSFQTPYYSTWNELLPEYLHEEAEKIIAREKSKNAGFDPNAKAPELFQAARNNLADQLRQQNMWRLANPTTNDDGTVTIEKLNPSFIADISKLVNNIGIRSASEVLPAEIVKNALKKVGYTDEQAERIAGVYLLEQQKAKKVKGAVYGRIEYILARLIQIGVPPKDIVEFFEKSQDGKFKGFLALNKKGNKIDYRSNIKANELYQLVDLAEELFETEQKQEKRSFKLNESGDLDLVGPLVTASMLNAHDVAQYGEAVGENPVFGKGVRITEAGVKSLQRNLALLRQTTQGNNAKITEDQIKAAQDYATNFGLAPGSPEDLRLLSLQKYSKWAIDETKNTIKKKDSHYDDSDIIIGKWDRNEPRPANFIDVSDLMSTKIDLTKGRISAEDFQKTWAYKIQEKVKKLRESNPNLGDYVNVRVMSPFAFLKQGAYGKIPGFGGQAITLPLFNKVGKNGVEEGFETDEDGNVYLPAFAPEVETVFKILSGDKSYDTDEQKIKALNSAGIKLQEAIVKNVSIEGGQEYDRAREKRFGHSIFGDIHGGNLLTALGYIRKKKSDWVKPDTMINRQRAKQRMAMSFIGANEFDVREMLGQYDEDTKVSDGLKQYYEELYGEGSWDKAVNSQGKSLSKQETIDQIVLGMTYGTKEWENLVKSGNWHGISALTGRFPFIQGIMDSPVVSMYIDKGLRGRRQLRIGAGLAYTSKADFDGDKMLAMLYRMNSPVTKDAEKALQAAREQSEAISQEVGEKLLGDYLKGEFSFDAQKGTYSLRNNGGKSAFKEGPETNGYKAITAFIARDQKGHTGTLSNFHTRVRNAIDKLGIGELAAENTPEAQEKLAQVLITRALFEAIEQEVISSKKIGERIANQRKEDPNGTNGKTDAELYKGIVSQADRIIQDFLQFKDLNKLLSDAKQFGIIDSEAGIGGRAGATAVAVLHQFRDANGNLSGEDILKKISGDEYKQGIISASAVDNAVKATDEMVAKGLLANAVDKSNRTDKLSEEQLLMNEDLSEQIKNNKEFWKEYVKQLGLADIEILKETEAEENKIGVAQKESQAIKDLTNEYDNYYDVLKKIAKDKKVDISALTAEDISNGIRSLKGKVYSISEIRELAMSDEARSYGHTISTKLNSRITNELYDRIQNGETFSPEDLLAEYSTNVKDLSELSRAAENSIVYIKGHFVGQMAQAILELNKINEMGGYTTKDGTKKFFNTRREEGETGEKFAINIADQIEDALDNVSEEDKDKLKNVGQYVSAETDYHGEVVDIKNSIEQLKRINTVFGNLAPSSNIDNLANGVENVLKIVEDFGEKLVGTEQHISGFIGGKMFATQADLVTKGAQYLTGDSTPYTYYTFGDIKAHKGGGFKAEDVIQVTAEQEAAMELLNEYEQSIKHNQALTDDKIKELQTDLVKKRLMVAYASKYEDETMRESKIDEELSDIQIFTQKDLDDLLKTKKANINPFRTAIYSVDSDTGNVEKYESSQGFQSFINNIHLINTALRGEKMGVSTANILKASMNKVANEGNWNNGASRPFFNYEDNKHLQSAIDLLKEQWKIKQKIATLDQEKNKAEIEALQEINEEKQLQIEEEQSGFDVAQKEWFEKKKEKIEDENQNAIDVAAKIKQAQEEDKEAWLESQSKIDTIAIIRQEQRKAEAEAESAVSEEKKKEAEERIKKYKIWGDNLYGGLSDNEKAVMDSLVDSNDAVSLPKDETAKELIFGIKKKYSLQKQALRLEEGSEERNVLEGQATGIQAYIDALLNDSETSESAKLAYQIEADKLETDYQDYTLRIDASKKDTESAKAEKEQLENENKLRTGVIALLKQEYEYRLKLQKVKSTDKNTITFYQSQIDALVKQREELENTEFIKDDTEYQTAKEEATTDFETKKGLSEAQARDKEITDVKQSYISAYNKQTSTLAEIDQYEGKIKLSQNDKEIAAMQTLLQIDYERRELQAKDTEEAQKKLQLLKDQGAITEKEYKELTSRLELDRQARLQKNTVQRKGMTNIWDSITNQFGMTIQRFAEYGAAYKLIGTIQQSFQKIITLTKELNQVMTNLRIVTGHDEDRASSLMKTYNDLASELGSTTQAVAKSAEGWLRQGYAISEANQLVKASTYLAALGQMSEEEATTSLTAALKGFKLEAVDVMGVVDELTSLDMEFATSAQSIAESLSVVASVANSAGLSLEETSAMLTTIMDVTQQTGSEAGNALKTIISRYGTVKAGSFESLEESGEDTEGLNDVERVLKSIGISIRTSSMEFRDFSDVLDELNEKWITLSTVEQNAVATALAGILMPECIEIYIQNIFNCSGKTLELFYYNGHESRL